MCHILFVFWRRDVIKIGAKRRHPVDASERTGEHRVKSRDGLSMAKRGLPNIEDQTKSAKSAKKKAEDAATARDAAPGSRVYTVEYQVDTAIEEFD